MNTKEIYAIKPAKGLLIVKIDKAESSSGSIIIPENVKQTQSQGLVIASNVEEIPINSKVIFEEIRAPLKNDETGEDYAIVSGNLCMCIIEEEKQNAEKV